MVPLSLMELCGRRLEEKFDTRSLDVTLPTSSPLPKRRSACGDTGGAVLEVLEVTPAKKLIIGGGEILVILETHETKLCALRFKDAPDL